VGFIRRPKISLNYCFFRYGNLWLSGLWSGRYRAITQHSPTAIRNFAAGEPHRPGTPKFKFTSCLFEVAQYSARKSCLLSALKGNNIRLTEQEGWMETDPGTLLYLESPEIEALGLAAARSTPPEYELLTDAWLEFKRRGREAKAGAYERKLAELGLAPISWLPKAREIAKQFRRKRRGNHHVYVILLDGYLAGGERYGLYIGETSKAVSVRFEEHVSGGRLAAQCHRKMRNLLPSLFEHINPLDKMEAKHLEARLIAAFREAGFRVEGS